jgi:hypothetical protein
MFALSLVQGEAATKLRPSERLVWAERGLLALRRGGKHRWIAALRESEQGTARDQMRRNGLLPRD